MIARNTLHTGRRSVLSYYTLEFVLGILGRTPRSE